MTRTISPLLIGIVSGALMTGYFLISGPGTGGSPGVRDPGSATPAAGAGVIAGSAPAYQDAYQAAARLDDPATLEQRLRQALASPFTLARDAEVGALFSRLAAIDVGRALRVAELPGFDVTHLARVIRGWAETSPDDALLALGAVRGASARRTIALALLDAFGDDAASIERIAAALPDYQRIDFVADAFAGRARLDPHGALGEALSLVDLAARNTVARRIGEEWVRRDPITAIAQAERLPREIRSTYLDVVAGEWARLDADGFLVYADAQRDITDLLQGMIRSLAADPERVYEIARNHPAVSIANVGLLERFAFTVMAEKDPRHALSVIETMQGQSYLTMRNIVVETWGRTRPEEALAWVRSLDPVAPDLEAIVIAYSAILDINRGLQLLEQFNPPANHPAMQAGVGTTSFIASYVGRLAADDPQRAQIADQLLRRSAADDERGALARQALQALTARWVPTDPEGALGWMLDNDQALDPALAANIAGQLAARDAALAASFVDRMPPAFHDIWLERVAPRYAQQDPQAALAWAQQFQGQPGYDTTLSQVVAATARVDPRSAAAAAAAGSQVLQQQSASAIANAWASEDLAGAGRWAAGLSDPEARGSAVATVASSWVARDPRGAQRWVSSLTDGDLRDQAATTVLSRVIQQGIDPDRNLMRSVGPEAVNAIVRSSLNVVAAQDPQRARALVDEWVTDAQVRATAEVIINSASR